MYDDSFIKCTKIGCHCDFNCKFFDFDSICKYEKYEFRYITAGQLWYLLQIAEDSLLDDRDFNAIIHTGKSIRKDKTEDQGVISNRVRANDPSSTKQNNKKSKNESKQKSNIDIVNDIVDKLTKEKMASTKDFINNINPKLKLPEHTLNIIAQIKDSDKCFNDYRITDYLSFIFNYIDLETSLLTENDIKTIFDYLIFDYKPKQKDFPLDKYINNDKISKLIEKTSNFEDDNTEKWTNTRYEFLINTKDEYLRTVYYDNEFYSWYMFGVIAQQNRKFDTITNLCIIIRYFIKTLILNYHYFYATTEIVLNFLDEKKLAKLKYVIGILKDIYEKNTNFKVESLFINEQITNLYIITMENIKFDGIMKKYRKLYTEKTLYSITELLTVEDFKKLDLFNGE